MNSIKFPSYEALPQPNGLNSTREPPSYSNRGLLCNMGTVTGFSWQMKQQVKPHRGAEGQPIYKLARSRGPPDARFATNDYVTDRKPVFTYTHQALTNDSQQRRRIYTMQQTNLLNYWFP